ncbi:BamA/TamA family outer membrane protein [Aquisalimonas sp.]|uniref:BamA/TamA family outer membrane protein n=1 Tax=Aquisalimonas sp. TaxID=1872621 RepID=UPI0025C389CE|nr:BamA/TamA family outer membrane protein [Aquisalimonas sp.]
MKSPFTFVALVLALASGPLMAESAARPIDWFFIPFPIHTPETGWALTLSAIASGRLGDTPPSSAIVSLAWSERDQKSISFDPTIYLSEDWLISGRIAVEDWPTDYFGIGNETDIDDQETFTARNLEFEADISHRVSEHGWLGPTVVVRDYTLSDVGAGSLLAADSPRGVEGGAVVGIGAVTRYDSREDVFAPRSGLLLNVSATFHDSAVGSDFDFQRYTLDARQYLTIRPDWVLVLTQYGAITRGDVPFQELALIGDSSPPARLRGHITGRFRDNDAAIMQAELRYPLYRRLSGVAFAGVGDVAARLTDLRAADMKWSAGLGLRFRATQAERINLRLDAGIAEDESGIYFALMEAF